MYDLGNAFHIDLSKGKANDECIIKGNKYRITILTERLIRIEYSTSGMFLDLPTETISNRYFNKPEFNIVGDDRYVEITTKYFKLYYAKEAKLNEKTIRVQSLEEGIEDYWYYGLPDVKTYDGVVKDIDKKSFYKGIYSPDGFSEINDSDSLVLDDKGILSVRKNDEIDIYVFVYGKDFNLALNDYMNLTGKPNLLPRYSFGTWWSKNTSYTSENIMYLINKFKKNNIPLSVLLLDSKWHKNKVTGYSFNKELIPNEDELIQNIHLNGIRLGININPTEGIPNNEEVFSNVINYIKPNENGAVTFSPLNPQYLDVMFKMLLHPLESKGIDFFWFDYPNKQVKEHYMLSHYSNIDSGRNENKRSISMSLSVPYSHKESIIYSGRSNVSFDSLKKQVYINTSASNGGVCYIASDIGGYNGGTENNELYTRNIELGCFSPILKISSDESKYYKREPWRWEPSTYNIVKEYLILRNKLIPYIYSSAYRYYDLSIPLVDPLYHYQRELYYEPNYKNEYMFGSELLVCPIVKSKDELTKLMHRIIQKVYLPDGIWYDFKTGKRYPGGRSYTNFYQEEDYPVFAKAGAIIPMNKDIDFSCSLPKTLEIYVFPKQSNTFTLYEDDGITNLYKDGYYLKTLIDYNYQENNYTLIIRAKEGKTGIAPNFRNYVIRFKNTLKTTEVVANFNGKDTRVNYYEDDNDFIVEIPNVPTNGQLSINCKGKALENDPIRLINEDIDDIISDLEIDTETKDVLANLLFGDLPLKKKRIEIRKLRRKKNINPNFIKMFLKLLEYVEHV